MARFAPNCLAKMETKRLVSSDEVTAINKSHSSILASFKMDIDFASP